MGKKKECYLQVLVETEKNRRTSTIVMTQKFWTVEEIEKPTYPFKHFHMLIKFKSMADRKKFIRIYTEGRVLHTNYFAVRFSPWKVPLCSMKSVSDKELQDILGPCRCDNLLNRILDAYKHTDFSKGMLPGIKEGDEIYGHRKMD